MQFVQRQYPFWFHEQWCIAARFHSSLMSRNQECLISTWTACLQRLNSGLWKDNGLQHGSTREVVLTGHFVTFIMNAAPAHLSHAEKWCGVLTFQFVHSSCPLACDVVSRGDSCENQSRSLSESCSPQPFSEDITRNIELSSSLIYFVKPRKTTMCNGKALRRTLNTSSERIASFCCFMISSRLATATFNVQTVHTCLERLPLVRNGQPD